MKETIRTICSLVLQPSAQEAFFIGSNRLLFAIAPYNKYQPKNHLSQTAGKISSKVFSFVCQRTTFFDKISEDSHFASYCKMEPFDYFK
jgi:hypothetical protein